jgi:hypothetical protein
MNVFRGWFHLVRHPGLLSLVLLLALAVSACAQPVRARPGPTPSPTRGDFYPTVVSFPSTTVVASPIPTATAVSTPQPVGEGAGSTFWGEKKERFL